jgi:predicted amidohydrolase
MTAFRVALLQAGACGTDLVASREKGLQFCSDAADMGVDLCLFPEMWSIGYSIVDKGFDAWQEVAIGLDDPYVTAFRELAAARGVAIGLTFLEKAPSGLRDSLALIDRRGEILFVYAKVHTCTFAAERACTPGEDFCIADLDIGTDIVRVGAMICYDREFPESARILALKGAEVILTPNACELESSRLGQFRSRAFENTVGAVMVNYPHVRTNGSWRASGNDNMNGRSVAYSPIAFSPPGSGGVPLDPLIVDAGSEEGIYVAAFDMLAIRDYRKHAIWGAKYRRPSKYTILGAAGTGSLIEP